MFLSQPSLPLLLLAACGANHKDPPVDPATPTAATEAPTTAAPEPAAAATAACAPSETVLFRQTQTPLRDPEGAPVWTLLIHDSGHWSADGIGEDHDKTGCLSAAVLTDLQTKLAAVEVVATPLGPDEMRCMAMPVTRSAVEIGGQQAVWKQPCGAERPSETLQALLNLIMASTVEQGAQP